MHMAALRALHRRKDADLTYAERSRSCAPSAARRSSPVSPPPQEVGARRLLAGLIAHSRGRDAVAISHHYDVSNRFYEWVLGPDDGLHLRGLPGRGHLARRRAGREVRPGLPQARPQAGQRLLDVGCGWGGMVRHAAQHYGVRAIGVTLSRQQAEWGQKAAAELGLTDLVEVRHGDYRDVAETGFDAISSIGLTEHIGVGNIPAYAHLLADKLRARRAAAQPLHHPPQRRRPVDRQARLHRAATSSRTASCRA